MVGLFVLSKFATVNPQIYAKMSSSQSSFKSQRSMQLRAVTRRKPRLGDQLDKNCDKVLSTTRANMSANGAPPCRSIGGSCKRATLLRSNTIPSCATSAWTVLLPATRKMTKYREDISSDSFGVRNDHWWEDSSSSEPVDTSTTPSTTIKHISGALAKLGEEAKDATRLNHARPKQSPQTVADPWSASTTFPSNYCEEEDSAPEIVPVTSLFTSDRENKAFDPIDVTQHNRKMLQVIFSDKTKRDAGTQESMPTGRRKRSPKRSVSLDTFFWRRISK